MDEGVDKLKKSLSGMPDTIKASINKSLEPLNELNVGKLFKTLRYIDTDKITADNVSVAADAAVKNKEDIINALKNMPIKDPAATYNQILVGLSQGQGAVSVYSVVNQSVTDSASTVQALKDGSAKVLEGASSLDTGLGQLADGASELSSGASDLVKGTTQLATGATELQTGTQSLADKLPELTKGITSLVNGSNELVKNNDTLNAGATALNAGASQLSAGTQSLMNSVPTLTSGIKQLVDGSNTLVANNAQLNSGASQLADGTNQIVSGVDQLTTGSKTLSEGAHTLADGMVQFNEEGINKILDAYNGDLKPFTDKLQAVIDAGEEYQTYSAIADGQTGSVKFIYKLASIDAKADSDK